MKTKSLILIPFIVCLLSACVSNNIVWSTNKNIKKVQLGMTKDEVIQILGEKYMITSASEDNQGNHIEVLGYKSDSDEEYKLKFVNNKLIEWDRERIPKYITEDPES